MIIFTKTVLSQFREPLERRDGCYRAVKLFKEKKKYFVCLQFCAVYLS